MNNYTETAGKIGVLQSSINIRDSLKEKISERKKMILPLERYISYLIYENDQAEVNLRKFDEQINVLQEDLRRKEGNK